MTRHGIYRIRNTANQKCYIGSASGKRGLKHRWWVHLHNLRRGTHHSIHLQRAWNKHGEDRFVFEHLLYCEPEECLTFEQIALDEYRPTYNICKTAGSPLGREVTLETRQRLSKALKGRRNGPHSLETCRKIASGVSGSKNGKAKLTEKQVDVIRLRLDAGVKGRELAAIFQVSPSTISEIKHGKRWSA